MATMPQLPSRDEMLRMARGTTELTGQLLDTAGNITGIAPNTSDPGDGSGGEPLRVLRRTTAELAGRCVPQAEAFHRIVDTLTRRLGTSGAPPAVHPVSEPVRALLRVSAAVSPAAGPGGGVVAVTRCEGRGAGAEGTRCRVRGEPGRAESGRGGRWREFTR